MVYKWMKTMDIKGRVEKSSQKNKKSKVSNTEARRKASRELRHSVAGPQPKTFAAEYAEHAEKPKPHH